VTLGAGRRLSSAARIAESGAPGLTVDQRETAPVPGVFPAWSPRILCAGGRAFCARTNEDFVVRYARRLIERFG